jgi:hypothetical protein
VIERRAASGGDQLDTGRADRSRQATRAFKRLSQLRGRAASLTADLDAGKPTAHDEKLWYEAIH